MKNEQHRRNVASLPCARCGLETYSQCAHGNDALFGKGLQMKSSDLFSFPLCCTRVGEVGCHVKHDHLIDYDGQYAEYLELKWIVETLETLYADGKLKIVK